MGNVNTEATNDLLVGVMERQVKRMFIIIIILIIGLIGTNVAWIVYESQFDTYTVTQEAEGEGDVNNYETARLIDNQTMYLTSQNSTNMINAIQGFNNIGQQIMNQTNVLGSKLDQLGYQMESCCCSIKTLIKDNQIADLTNQLNQANNAAINGAQSQFLLSQMGKWVANAPAATT